MISSIRGPDPGQMAAAPVLLFPLVLAVLLVGCGEGGPPAAETAGTVRTTIGDTVRVTSTTPAEGRFVTDSIEILWQSPELENPVAMARLSDGYVVLDPTRVHVLDPDGAYRLSASREGEGPGELGAARAVGVRGDTIVVLDSRHHRLSLFDREGTFLASRGQMVLPAEPISLGPSRRGPRLGFAGRGVLFEIEAMMVSLDAPLQRGAAWAAFDSDSLHTLFTMDDVRFQDTGQLLADPDPYGPRAHVALGYGGRYAASDGQEYCVDVQTMDEPGVLSVCRAWERVPVSEAARNPDLSRVPEDRREAVRSVLEAEKPGSHHPSLSTLELDDRGRLWVHVVDDRYADVWPFLRTYAPELRPEYVPWDVFSTDGELLRRVEVRDGLRVHLFGDESLVGFYDLPTGEVVVARARLKPHPEGG